ncbi:MAG: sugar ABC transporter substrate-binding protein [Chloroflexota bacterium]|nr:substrate-binding domain-containing protein [Caldilinea sp.]GIK75073.1 MAG: sugar ABC transporter substrate-binding protein [Chloroflexota bacterium]
MNHSFVRLLLALVLIVSLAGCTAVAPAPSAGDAAAPAEASITVAVVTPYMANATTKYAIEQFEKYGKEQGWNVTVTDTNADFNQLVSRIEDAVTQQVDAIVLGMGDPAQMTKGLEAAQAAGIPVFGLDAGNGPGVVLNITSDNGQLGKETAHFLAEAIGGKGNVIMFTHDPHPGVRARAEAAAAEFANYPEITVIEKKHIEVPGPVDFARNATQDLLTAYPNDGDIAGIWAGWDEPALGATQAIEAAGRSGIVVVGIDGTDFARAEIAKGGPFAASIAQDFDGMAKQLVEIIAAYLKGEKPASDSVQIPGVLVTGE